MNTKTRPLADCWDTCLPAVLDMLHREGRKWVTIHVLAVDSLGHVRVKVVEAAPPQGHLDLDGENVGKATSDKPCA